jgi:hypothetical protein
MTAVGKGFTVTVAVLLAEHPLVLVPVTVYIVVPVGVTFMGLDVPSPLQL